MSITTNHIPVSVSTPQPPTPSPSALQPSSSPAPSSSNLDAPHPGLTISSEQVNAVLFNYLVESGYQHSAFTFLHESQQARHNVRGGKDGKEKTPSDFASVPRGALISFLSKGLLYYSIECHDGTEITSCDEPFTLTGPHKCVINSKKRTKTGATTQQRIAPAPVVAPPAPRRRIPSPDTPGVEEPPSPPSPEENVERAELPQSFTSSAVNAPSALNVNTAPQLVASPQALPFAPVQCPSAMEVDPSVVNIDDSSVVKLMGHVSEVFVCAWNPVSNIVASGSAAASAADGDATARIWYFGPPPRSVILNHTITPGHENHTRDVTSLDWNPAGSRLATGSYDGTARIWTSTGDLLRILDKHTEPIFTLKWNKAGTRLLSGSVDHSAIVWDTVTGDVLQQFRHHQSPILDVDWRDDATFASCSSDQSVLVCKVGETKALKCFVGHRDEVNIIKWDPSGNLLASCSDDHTAKIWDMNHDKFIMELWAHQKEVYTCKWSPSGSPGGPIAADLLLATTSFDTTVKLWDVSTGKVAHSLEGHTEPVYSVAFNPDGKLLATGSFDGCVHIWSVKTYKRGFGVFECGWNYNGDKIAACYADGAVCVFDVRK